MFLGEVGLRGLNAGGDLNFVYIPRLNLRLHQVVELSIDTLADDAKVADLVLQDNGLFYGNPLPAHPLKPLHPEKGPAGVTNLAGGFVVVPGSAGIEGDMVNGNVDSIITSVDPIKYFFRHMERHFITP